MKTLLLSFLFFPVLSHAELTVIQADGVFKVDSQMGQRTGQLAKGAFAWGRKVEGGVVLFNAADGTLWQTGKTLRQIGELPTHIKGCTLTKGPPTLSLQTPLNLQLGSSSLCVELADRNDNMREMAAAYVVDLKTGKVSSTLLEAPGCPAAQPEQRCVPSKPAVARRAPLPTHPLGPFEAVTPSGRYGLVALPTSQGDYMHAALIGVDLKKKTVHRITEKGWQPPATAAEKARWKANPEAIKAIDVVGESLIRAVPREEAFYVDGLLIRPGKAPIKVGTLVW